jgi:hypothetical protein
MRRTTLGPLTGSDLLNTSALDSSAISLTDVGGKGGRASLSTSFSKAFGGGPPKSTLPQQQSSLQQQAQAPGTGKKSKTTTTTGNDRYVFDN